MISSVFNTLFLLRKHYSSIEWLAINFVKSCYWIKLFLVIDSFPTSIDNPFVFFCIYMCTKMGRRLSELNSPLELGDRQVHLVLLFVLPAFLRNLFPLYVYTIRLFGLYSPSPQSYQPNGINMSSGLSVNCILPV